MTPVGGCCRKTCENQFELLLFISFGGEFDDQCKYTCDFRCEGGAREGRGEGAAGVQPAAVDNRRRD